MPTTGYNNTQFYNIATAAGEYKYGSPRNKAFMYKSRGSTLQKGYIRTLYGNMNTATNPARKCSFQFNPAVISQSVQQSDKTYNPLFTDPGELATPGVSSANFAFSIRFDRTMELNNVDPKAAIKTSTNYNVWEKNDPSQVGVLHDLAIFYSVIGQTFTTESLDALLNYASTMSKAGNSTTIQGPPAPGSAAPTSSSALSMLRSNGTLGNTAVLSPIPVRVVFSSLFMVDGFVQNTDITFSKFNKAMVPMVVDVNVTMEAKYIGFARKNTPLTLEYVNAQQTVAEQHQQTVQEAAAYTSAASSVISSVEVSLKGHAPNTQLNIIDMLSSKDVPIDLNMVIPNAKGSVNDAVGRLFADGGFATNVSIGGDLTVFGPYASPPRQGTTQASLAALTANTRPLLQAYLYSTDKNCTATNEDQWTKLATSANSSNRVQKTTNSAVSGPVTFTVNSVYYIVRYNVAVNIRGTGINNLRGEGKLYVSVNGALLAGMSNPLLTQRVNMTWPKATVPPLNTGTKPGQPSQTGTGKTPTKPGVI